MVCLALLLAVPVAWATEPGCVDQGPPDRDGDGLLDDLEQPDDSDRDGCDDVVDDDDDGDGVPTRVEDFDGDGDYDDDSERLNRGDRPGAWLDENSPLDDDGDGFVDLDWGGDDCEDSYRGAHPGGTERWYDGVDGDCDGWPDDDQDRDGWDRADECDDLNPLAYPGAPEDVGPEDRDCDGDTDPHHALRPNGGCACAQGASPSLLPAFGLLLGLVCARRWS
jgi:hypothetical protein